MAETFATLGLIPPFVAALEREGILTPTEIQKRAIPLALQNKDTIGQSQTGTGKTLAYLLPVFQKINVAEQQMQAVILVPTHELAIQIQRQIENLANNSTCKVTGIPIIGNVNIARQIVKLKEKPHIIVGSPGRILELIQKRKISAHTIKTIVVDEADRLLDKNNVETVRAIIKSTLRERQLMFFSASISQAVVKFAEEVMKEPNFAKVTEQAAIASSLKHMYFVADQRDKTEVLRKLLKIVLPQRALIFVNKSEDMDIIIAKLKYHGFAVEGINSTSIKTDRKKAMEDFRVGKISYLVASDVAARGLDIKGITHVFNLDLPEKSQDYLHRAGRTGRGGEAGTVISVVTSWEIPLIKDYEKFFKVNIEEKDMYMGRIVDRRQPRPNKPTKAKAKPSFIRK